MGKSFISLSAALALEALHKQVLPFLLRRLKEDVLHDLQLLFRQLRDAYEVAENERLLPIPFTVANGLHAQFAQTFREISERFLHDDVTIALNQESYARLREVLRSTSKPLSNASVAGGKKPRGDDDNIEDMAGPSGRPSKKQRTEETCDTLPQATGSSRRRSKLRD